MAKPRILRDYNPKGKAMKFTALFISVVLIALTCGGCNYTPSSKALEGRRMADQHAVIVDEMHVHSVGIGIDGRLGDAGAYEGSKQSRFDAYQNAVGGGQNPQYFNSALETYRR